MHIHIPDGFLPIWLWVLGYMLMMLFIYIALTKINEDNPKKIVWTSAIAAMMLVAMSIPLGIPYHLNLTVLAGIILGPWWSLLACFVVNGVLASFGHGGITIVGLNTLITWFEALTGLYLYKNLRKMLEKASITVGISTWTSLTLSALLVIGLVAVSGVNPALAMHHETSTGQISITTFAFLTLFFALPGAAVEGVITALILAYIKRVRPTLFEEEGL